jgi:hypothetical protein
MTMWGRKVSWLWVRHLNHLQLEVSTVACSLRLVKTALEGVDLGSETFGSSVCITQLLGECEELGILHGPISTISIMGLLSRRVKSIGKLGHKLSTAVPGGTALNSWLWTADDGIANGIARGFGTNGNFFTAVAAVVVFDIFFLLD